MGSDCSKLKLNPQQQNELKRETGLTDQEFKDLYDKFFKDFNGRISHKQFRNIFHEAYAKDQAADAYADCFFRMYDSNNDGHLDVREFIRGPGLLARGTEEQKLRIIFNILSTGKEEVTQTNVHRVITALETCKRLAARHPIRPEDQQDMNQRAHDIFNRLNDRPGTHEYFTSGHFVSKVRRDHILRADIGLDKEQPPRLAHV